MRGSFARMRTNQHMWEDDDAFGWARDDEADEHQRFKAEEIVEFVEIDASHELQQLQGMGLVPNLWCSLHCDVVGEGDFETPIEPAWVHAALQESLERTSGMFAVEVVSATVSGWRGDVAVALSLRARPDVVAHADEDTIIAAVRSIEACDPRRIADDLCPLKTFRLAHRSCQLGALARWRHGLADAGRFREHLLARLARLARSDLGREGPLFPRRRRAMPCDARDGSMIAAMELYLRERQWFAERGAVPPRVGGAIGRIQRIVEDLRGPAAADGLGPITRRLWRRLGPALFTDCIMHGVVAVAVEREVRLIATHPVDPGDSDRAEEDPQGRAVEGGPL